MYFSLSVLGVLLSVHAILRYLGEQQRQAERTSVYMHLRFSHGQHRQLCKIYPGERNYGVTLLMMKFFK